MVNQLGKALIAKIYDPADVYHSDNIDTVSEGFIQSAGITEGTFDNISSCMYVIPSHWDIGKFYKRLILGIAKEKGLTITDALFEAYNSFVSDKISDYNSSFYYDAPQNILTRYQQVLKSSYKYIHTRSHLCALQTYQ